MTKEWGRHLFFGGAAAFLLPSMVSAHEIYVLEDKAWQAGMTAAPINLLESLNSPSNLILVLVIAVVALAALAGAIFFSQSKAGLKIDDYLLKRADIGRLILRIALAIALFIGAQNGAMLGPEILVAGLPAGVLIHFTLYGLSILTLLGWMTELTAAILVVIYAFIIWTYGAYGFTYLGYFGEMLVLMLFGAGYYSIDRRYAKATPKHSAHITDLEALIIRVAYGLAFLYTAITVKFLHPAVSLEVVSQYNLTQFSWLFPSDPTLVVLGAGIVESVIGLSIILGLQTRLIVIFSLFHMTLSVFFFGEAVWPHLILYGISAYLIFTNGGRLTLDRYLLAVRK